MIGFWGQYARRAPRLAPVGYQGNDYDQDDHCKPEDNLYVGSQAAHIDFSGGLLDFDHSGLSPSLRGAVAQQAEPACDESYHACRDKSVQKRVAEI
jgi:hypothetical protein